MHPLTAAAIPIDLLRRDAIHGEIVGATGMAFLFNCEGPYLITAWHNVTGYDYRGSKLLHSKGFIPEILRYGLWKRAGPGLAAREWREINLIGGDVTWYQHPSNPGEIDISALPIDFDESQAWLSKPVNALDMEKRLTPKPGQEAFVIGFPENISGPSRTAIWKRASVASEAAIPHNGQEFFYVDTATRKGMSGSPVIIRHHGIFDPESKNGSLTLSGIIGTVENFCGIYVGRVGDDELGVQLGIVWKEQAIVEVIESKSPGKNPALD